MLRCSRGSHPRRALRGTRQPKPLRSRDRASMAQFSTELDDFLPLVSDALASGVLDVLTSRECRSSNFSLPASTWQYRATARDQRQNLPQPCLSDLLTNLGSTAGRKPLCWLVTPASVAKRPPAMHQHSPSHQITRDQCGPKRYSATVVAVLRPPSPSTAATAPAAPPPHSCRGFDRYCPTCDRAIAVRRGFSLEAVRSLISLKAGTPDPPQALRAGNLTS
jgi:hypothetical protein